MRTTMFILLFSFSAIIWALPATENALILDNAQKPQMSRWAVEGVTSSNTGVDYIAGDKERNKKVIRLKGAGLNTVFTFRGEKGSDLALVDYDVLQWKMKYSEPFMIQVDVTTSEGKKHILYSDLSNKVNNDDLYLHIGIGSRYTDGKWHIVTRDLAVDMSSILAHVKLKSIDRISFRGSGYVDDIKAFKRKPEDIIIYTGEKGLSGWIKERKLDKKGKYGKLTAGEIGLDYDAAMGQVMRFNSGEQKVLFSLRNKSGSSWSIRNNSLLQWKMRMLSPYGIFVSGRSTSGRYSLYYDNSDRSGSLHYGLGSETLDGQWRAVTRDLSNDARTVHRGTEVLTIDSITVYGNGYIGDIRLLADTSIGGDTAKNWEVYDNEPKGATVRTINDIEKGEIVELTGDSLKNGYKFSDKNGIQNSKEKSFVKWDINFSETFDVMLMVESSSVVRYIHYVPMPESYIKEKDGELYIGIGDTKTDGRWHTIVRDLSADVKLLSQDSVYNSCKAFLVRGSGKIGKISFYKSDPLSVQANGASAVASMVIGQFDFTHNLKNIWDMKKPPVNSLNSPNSVAVDNEGGIYVCDTDNNRVLYWNSIPSVYGENAEIILNKQGFKQPAGIFASDEELFVADTGNNRILVFDLPLSENAVPRLVIEGDIKQPRGIFYDGKKFFVADTGNNRVLIWNGIPRRAKKPFDVVLGQFSVDDVAPNKGNDAPSFDTMSSPYSMFSDGTALYVADTGNNRVLVFKQIPLMNGWHADLVIGQDNFKSDRANKGKPLSASSLNRPTGVCVYNSKLFVSDSMNNRLLIYTKYDGDDTSADGVIGQNNFTSSTVNYPSGIPNPGSLSSPADIFMKKGILFVSDRGNNRILIY